MPDPDTEARLIEAELTEQTSLFALNAVIEAARAGEARNSFAAIAAGATSLAVLSTRAVGDFDARMSCAPAPDVASAARSSDTQGRQAVCLQQEVETFLSSIRAA